MDTGSEDLDLRDLFKRKIRLHTSITTRYIQLHRDPEYYKRKQNPDQGPEECWDPGNGGHVRGVRRDRLLKR